MSRLPLRSLAKAISPLSPGRAALAGAAAPARLASASASGSAKLCLVAIEIGFLCLSLTPRSQSDGLGLALAGACAEATAGGTAAVVATRIVVGAALRRMVCPLSGTVGYNEYSVLY